MGVGLCLIFLLWFCSGIVLMYHEYPGVTNADRLAHEPALDPSRITLSPAEAYARLPTSVATNGTPDQARLMAVHGRPAYRFRDASVESTIYADNGEMQDDFSREFCLEVAAAWTGRAPNEAMVKAQTTPDQWTVSGEFAAVRPLLKFSWPAGEEVYVSQITGDVVQFTTRKTRMWAYFGAIPHWLYFTPLRTHGALWSRTVIWASGLGALASLIGIVIAVWVYSPGKRYRRAGSSSSIPYSGQKRWHMILGLTFGVLACTWSFSGMLSMDPFPQSQGTADEPEPSVALASALEGDPVPMSAFAARSPREALLQVDSGFKVKELQLISFAGAPLYLATAAPGQTRLIPVAGGRETGTQSEFPHEQIIGVLSEAARPARVTEVRTVTQYESYYVDRHYRLPLPAIFLRLNDPEHSTFYVDPKTARIVQSYTSRSRANRWLYHGLHSMDVPWLYSHRPAWDIVVLTLLAGGASLCVTALVLAWRVLGRKLGAIPEERT
jgi:hypothetical protein